MNELRDKGPAFEVSEDVLIPLMRGKLLTACRIRAMLLSSETSTAIIVASRILSWRTMARYGRLLDECGPNDLAHLNNSLNLR